MVRYPKISWSSYEHYYVLQVESHFFRCVYCVRILTIPNSNYSREVSRFGVVARLVDVKCALQLRYSSTNTIVDNMVSD